VLFANRAEAGRALAKRLQKYADRSDTIVLALPRGGVPVAFEVAKALKAPLDILVVRKLGVPGHPEFAMGAIATGDVRILNNELITHLGISSSTLDRVAAEELQELKRRETLYRGQRPAFNVSGRTVILVDDGLATGATMRAAAVTLRKQNPARIIVAVPVGALDTCNDFKADVDETVCLEMPEPFYGVGQWYVDFSQTTDEEVQRLLAQARH
jgi:putative phosphoribosyl transferase